MKEIIGLFLKGAAMGAANVIPGVSGGTIAFITGIYERLINALKNFDLSLLKLVLKGDFATIWQRIDIKFLIALFGGIGVSILSLAKVLELAFTHYESLTLSFFFGLIVASIIGVGRQISYWNVASIAALLIGVAIAVAIALLPPAEANDNTFYVILCGMVAVSSMILPGLSGSYVLLLMGNYILALQAISTLDFGFLIPMLLGCVIGMMLFSKLLSYLFAHYQDATISLLTGFVAGSLMIIWPWKETNYLEIDGKEKAMGYEWLLPIIDSQFAIAVALSLIGFGLVWWMDRVGTDR